MGVNPIAVSRARSLINCFDLVLQSSTAPTRHSRLDSRLKHDRAYPGLRERMAPWLLDQPGAARLSQSIRTGRGLRIGL